MHSYNTRTTFQLDVWRTEGDSNPRYAFIAQLVMGSSFVNW